jgi:hypothetical protein
MKAIRVSLLLLLSSLTLGAQTLNHPDLTINQPTGPKPWTNRNINDKPGQFQFAIVTDRTGGHRPGVFEDGVRKLNLLQPEFVMSVGDLIEGYTTDTVELKRQWDEFDGFVNQLDMPFFYVPGNHDLTNPVQEKIWAQRLGPTHYSFVYKNILFIALNSEDQTRGSGRGTISTEQYEWIKKTLAAHTTVQWTFLFMHQPLWVQEENPARWFDVEKLLADRKHTVFVGHRHHYVQYERNKSNYYMLATTGGASPLRGPQFGEFDHFVWITMTEQGPVLANLQLEGIFDSKLHTEKIETFTSKLWASDVVRVEPLYSTQSLFKKDSVRFRITNSFDSPVTVKLNTGFSWDLKTDLGKPEVLIQPNSVAFVTMLLEARKPKAIEDLRPVKVKAEVSVKGQPAQTDFFVPFDFNVAPLKRYKLITTNKPVAIDGKLNEWQLPYTLPTNETTKFGIMYDKTNLYIGVDVTDSEIISPSALPAFNQDFVGFVLDAQPLAKSAADRGEAWFKNSLYFIAGPEDEQGKNSVWDLGESEKELKWKCIRTEKGYAFELAVPISYLQSLQGNAWQTVRLNIVVQDKDKTETKRTFWQPNWREADNIPGSGMFFKK